MSDDSELVDDLDELDNELDDYDEEDETIRNCGMLRDGSM